MEKIKIIQVDNVVFEYRDVEYCVESRRYMDFHQLQDEIDRMIKKGATHLFIYNVKNTNDDGTPICKYQEDNISDVWIRCKFKKLIDNEF